MQNKLKTIDADTLLSMPMKKSNFLIDSLLPLGMHILCGASKIGKSWMMLWLCLQVAEGKPVWGMQSHASDVLYLCLEDTFPRIQERLYALTDAAPDNLRLAVTCGRLGNGLKEEITSYLEDFPGTKLIVIDTLQKIRGSGSAANRSGMYGSDYEDITMLKEIADHHGIAIVAVHHLRKQIDNDDPFNQITGTTGITGAVDSSYVLKKDSRSADTALLLATGRDIEYQQLVLRFQNQIWQLIERKDERELQKDEVPAFLFQVVEFMQNKSEWAGTATDLRDAVGNLDVNPVSITKLLGRYYYEVLEPHGINYTMHRTGKRRQLKLTKREDESNEQGY